MMKLFYKSAGIVLLCLFLIFFIFVNKTHAASYTVTSSASWSSCADFTSTPTNADNITINSSQTLTVDVTNAICGSITISSGATLTFNASGSPALTVTTAGSGTGILTVTGTLTMVSGASLTIQGFSGSGTYNVSTGSITTNGTSPGVTSGKTWGSLTINAGTVNFTGSSNVFNTALTVGASAVVTCGGGAVIKGTGTLSGTGAIRLNASGNSDDLSHQYHLTRDLSTLTLKVDGFNGTPQVIDTEIVCAAIISGTFIAGTTNFNQNVTVTGNVAISSGAEITIGSGATFSPASSSVISGSGTLDGSGTILVTATGNANDLTAQYTVTTLTLTNLTVGYAGSGTAQNLPSGTYSTFKVTNSSGVNLGGAVTISGTLDLTGGSISLGSNNLTLSSGAIVSNASSSNYIKITGSGSVIAKNITTSTTIPVGDEYAPVTIGSGGGADYTISLAGSVTDNGGSPTVTDHAVGITWTITPSITVTNVSITVQWPGANELSSFDRTNSYIAQRTSPSGTWNPLAAPSAASGSNPYTQTATISSMTGSTAYDFGVGDNVSTALPVSFLNFTAGYNNGSAILTWSTATEINNSHFEIERSTDGQQWQAIGRVEGHGSTRTIQQYQYEDGLIDMISTEVFYRLKQVDYNGAFAYSVIRSIRIKGHDGAYPVPAANVLFVQWDNPKAEAAMVYIKSISGTVLFSQGAAAGNTRQQVDVSLLKPGIYSVEIVCGTTIKQYRFLKE